MSNLRNYSHTSNFRFQSNLFNDEETIYSVQEVPLPGLSYSHIQANKSSVPFNIQGDTLIYNDLILSFIIDEKLVLWKDIVKTMKLMRDSYTSESKNIKEYSYLEILDDNSNLVLKIEFVNCVIESIDDLMFSTTSEDEIITCSVTLKYDYYNILD